MGLPANVPLQRESPCAFADCGNPSKSRGYCNAHYQQLRSGKPLRPARPGNPKRMSDVCVFPDCGRRARSIDLCSTHAQQRRKGQELRPIKTPRPTPSGRGSYGHDGYVVLSMKDHPSANRAGRIYEHVYLMIEALGRPLTKGESVHHRNGQRDDNRLENLELWSSAQPAGQRVVDKVEFALEILREYQPESLR